MASDGRVSIVGRAKDLIISGGYNIYPKEIEDVLNADPTVLESAVFGVPHPDSGESVFAAIVAEPGQTVDDQALQTHAAAHLAKFKLPRRFVVMDALPLNTMGKVQKNVLRGRFST